MEKPKRVKETRIEFKIVESLLNRLFSKDLTQERKFEYRGTGPGRPSSRLE